MAASRIPRRQIEPPAMEVSDTVKLFEILLAWASINDLSSRYSQQSTPISLKVL